MVRAVQRDLRDRCLAGRRRLGSVGAQPPIAEGTYLDASSDGNLTFRVYTGKLGVGGKTPTGAIWASVYKYIDKETVQAGKGDTRMTMRLSERL